jgi:AcrR family transcriptional regulator
VLTPLTGTAAAAKPAQSAQAAGRPRLAGAILDAARKLCFADGAAAVTARRIAAEVGCTAPALYRHYRGVDDVLHALRMEGHRLLGDALVSPAPDLPSDRRLVAMQECYFRFGMNNPRYFGLMFPALLPAGTALEFGADEAATLLIVAAEAERGISSGAIRTDLEPTLIANYCWLAVHSLTATQVSGHLAATAPGLAGVLLEQIQASTHAWLVERGAIR